MSIMMNKRRLLQINSVVGTGSTGRIVEWIAGAAQLHGWETATIVGRKSGKSEHVLFDYSNKLSTLVHFLLTRILDKHGKGSILATHRIIHRIKRFQPDVIHLHNLHGYYVNIELLLKYIAKSNIQCVITMHDCWLLTGHCAYFDFVNCQRWKDTCYSCPQLSTYPKSFMDNSTLNHRRKKELFQDITKITLVPVSNWLSKKIDSSHLRSKDIKVIHNGIDLSKFCYSGNNEFRETYKIGNQRIILGVANDWSPRKGLKDFIELNNRIDHRDYVIVLVGVKRKLQSILPKEIRIVPKTNSIAELAQIYSESSVFVNPTYEDNYPTTNLEAMACGTPVLTYNTGGSPESITNETGLVVECGDVDKLMEGVNFLCKQNRSLIRQKCIEHAAQNFCSEKQYKKYISLYDSLIHKTHYEESEAINV